MGKFPVNSGVYFKDGKLLHYPAS